MLIVHLPPAATGLTQSFVSKNPVGTVMLLIVSGAAKPFVNVTPETVLLLPTAIAGVNAMAVFESVTVCA
jgi:hypothetical protein